MVRLNNKKKSSINFPLIGAFAVLGTVVIAALVFIASAPSYDEVTGCLKGTTTTDTVFLIDTTGGFSKNQVRIVKSAINKRVNEASIGERFILHYIDSTEFNGLSNPTFDLCKPKSGKEANALIENERKIQIDFEKKFLGGLEKELIIRESSSADSSPLLESLMDLSSRYSTISNQRLENIVFVSDLLQHTDDISFYKRALPSLNDDPTTIKFVADLQNAKLDVLYLLRKDSEQQYQTVDMLNWWGEYSEFSNLKDFTITKIR